MKKIALIMFLGLLLVQVLPAIETSTDTALIYPKMKLTGFGRVRYTSDAAAGKIDGFSIAQGRFGITGDINELFSYTFTIETSNTDTENRKMLYDLYLDTTIIPTFKFRLGQFKYPFGLEQTTPDADLELINKADVVNNLIKPTRDIGLQVSRDIPILGLRPNLTLALVNGSGFNLEDENARKSFIGRLTLNPLNGLVLGASYYDGTTGVADKKVRTGVDFKYENNRLLAKGEYIVGKDILVNKEGYYLTLGYTFLPGTVFLVRYDWWNTNKDKADLDTSRVTLALNYFFSKNLLMRVNYEIKNEAVSVKNDVFMIQMQVKL